MFEHEPKNLSSRRVSCSVPILEHQLQAPSAFTPEALVAAVRKQRGLAGTETPAVCVLDFDGDLTDWLARERISTPNPSWACFHTQMSTVEVDGVRCGIIPRTIGGPYAVLVAEQLAVSGTRVVLGLTSAGRVLESLPLPSLVVAESAVRDEGVSYHYLPPAETVPAPPFINDYLIAELGGLELPVRCGRVWTTDAPYRETREQLEAHARQNVLAVEMQAASLLAFAKARGVVAGVVAHVTNGIDQTGEFDKGPEEFGLALYRSICRAGTRVLSSQ